MKSHLLPGNCYVCGGEPHADGSHRFWSNAAAEAEVRAESRRLGEGRTWADGVFAEERPWPEVDAV